MALCISKRRLFLHLETTPLPQLRVAFRGRGEAKEAPAPQPRTRKEALIVKVMQGSAAPKRE